MTPRAGGSLVNVATHGVETLSAQDDRHLARAAELLLAGRLVVLPTDTVYGLAALPTREGVAAIRAAKGRPADKPIPLLASDATRLAELGVVLTAEAAQLAARYWPDPLTLVVNAPTELAQALGAADGTAGVRVPDHTALRRVIEMCGGALAITSANRSGDPEARSAAEAALALGAAIAAVVDGGPSGAGEPSTVVHCAGGPPQILRAGSLADEIALRLRTHDAAP